MGIFGSVASKVGMAIKDKKEKIEKAQDEILKYSESKIECLKYGCDRIRSTYDKDMIRGMAYANACRKLASDNIISDEQLKDLYMELHNKRNIYALNAVASSMQNRGLLIKDENGYHRNW